MLSVFVSRPTTVLPGFTQGLDGFLEVLDKMDLTPRTLGSTDQPTSSPLDEVIRLLDECVGAVVLGYPQLRVDTGELKGAPLGTPLLLPTEWNHIEAGLAYARDLPLLVIHHTGVGRGIFDRGAIGGFLYEVDLSTATWPLETPVSGALKAWKAKVLEPRRGGRMSVSPDTAEALEGHRRKALPEDLVRVLEALAQEPQGRLQTSTLAAAVDVADQKAQYYLDELLARKLISLSLYTNRPPYYSLGPTGRSALVERGLL